MGSRLRIVVATIGVVAAVLGTIGVFELLDPSISFKARLLESIYLSLHLFTISYPDYLVYATSDEGLGYSISWQLQIARFIAPIVTVTAAVSLFSAVLEKRVKRLKVALFYRQHAVVYGFNLRSKLMCEDLLLNRKKVIVIDPDLDEQELEWARKKGIVAFQRSGTDSEVPRLCKAEKAKYLFAAYDDDALNLKILVRAYQRNREIYESLLDDRKKLAANKFSTHFYAHFSEASFKRLKFGGQFSNLDGYFKLHIFNVYDQSAKRLVKQIYQGYSQRVLSGEPIHVYLFGLGASGAAMLEQLVRMAYFKKGSQVRISVFDDKVEYWNRLVSTFPILEPSSDSITNDGKARLARLRAETCFPEISFFELDLDSEALVSGRALGDDADETEIRIAVLCRSESTRNLALADNLMQQRRYPIEEIFIRSDEPESEIRKYVRSEMARKRLSSFPPQDEICRLDALRENRIERLARVIHEAYLSETREKSPPQPSNASWERLDESFKESNRRAAAHIDIKCALLGLRKFDLESSGDLNETAKELRRTLNRPEQRDELEMLSECEHNRWCAEKLLDGWIPCPDRNDALKHHPNLVPWDLDDLTMNDVFSGFASLTEEDKSKDRHNITKIPDYLEEIAN